MGRQIGCVGDRWLLPHQRQADFSAAGEARKADSVEVVIIQFLIGGTQVLVVNEKENVRVRDILKMVIK